MNFIDYKKKSIEVVSAIRLERAEIKNQVYAVEYDQVKTMLSCLVGWLIVAVVYVDYIGYLIVKKIK